ncbi:MAG: CCA tRNA nucleotidyltransferase, partial [Alphaproteobacteria bacterium]|nr:CCA tRNA nucleotidyltransferase [Alphaproteobacteria bacterium]
MTLPPSARIPPEPWMTSASVARLFAALTANGAAARFVGGCVRDAVLGRPVKDVDIATAETPQAVI